jgi:hypothetical protein
MGSSIITEVKSAWESGEDLRVRGPVVSVDDDRQQRAVDPVLRVQQPAGDRKQFGLRPVLEPGLVTDDEQGETDHEHEDRHRPRKAAVSTEEIEDPCCSSHARHGASKAKSNFIASPRALTLAPLHVAHQVRMPLAEAPCTCPAWTFPFRTAA